MGLDVAEVVQELRKAGLRPSPEQEIAFNRYLELIRVRGEQINLVSQRDRSRLASRHLLESFNVLLWPIELSRERLADVGSGAGFPGLPLAIWQPDVEVYLIESVFKKAQFLDVVRRKLRLDRVRVVHSRVENAARKPELGGTFGVVTARGLGPLSRVVRWVAPLLREKGTFIAFKGTDVDRELKGAMSHIAAAGLGLVDVVPLRWGQGNLVILERLQGVVSSAISEREGRDVE